MQKPLTHQTYVNNYTTGTYVWRSVFVIRGALLPLQCPSLWDVAEGWGGGRSVTGNAPGPLLNTQPSFRREQTMNGGEKLQSLASVPSGFV